MVKIVNITIADSAHRQLENVKRAKKFANNAEAFAYLIDEGHKALFGGAQ